jgi:cell division transport system permease protein
MKPRNIKHIAGFFIVAFFYVMAVEAKCFAIEIAVRVEESASQDVLAELEQSLRGIPNVATVTFICRYEALESMARALGEEAVRGLWENNPLRDSFVVEPYDSDYCDEIKIAISSLYGVAQVDCNCEFINTFRQARTFAIAFYVIAPIQQILPIIFILYHFAF